MTTEAVKNFAATTVKVVPSPPTTGTSIELESVSLFGSTPFYAIVCPSLRKLALAYEQPNASNAEVVKVSSITGKIATIVRQEQSTSARSIEVGDQFYQGVTQKLIEELQAGEASLGSEVVETANIKALNVTAAKLAEGSVETAKLASGAVTEAKLGSEAVAAAKIKGEAVTEAKLASEAVTTAKIASGAVTAVKLASSAATTAVLASNAVTLAKIDAGSAAEGDVLTAKNSTELEWKAPAEASIGSEAVTAAKLHSEAVETAKIKALAVTEAKLASEAVTEGKLATGAVVAAKIGTGAVTEAKLGSEAVAAGKLASNAVTYAKIDASGGAEGKVLTVGASSTLEWKTPAEASIGEHTVTGGATGEIAHETITGYNIEDGAISYPQLGTGAVTEGKLGSEAVKEENIKGNAVTTAKINAEAVTAAKIASEAITEAKMHSASVNTAAIVSEAVTEAKLASSAVVAAKIASGAVTEAKLGSEAVTAAKLHSSAVELAKIDAGSSTAGYFLKVNSENNGLEWSASGAGGYEPNGGTESVAVGTGAGNGIHGAQNTSIGYHAGAALSGSGRGENTLIGAKAAKALDSATEAYGNVVLGYDALPVATLAKFNTIIGNLSGAKLTSATAQIAIGQEALVSLVNGVTNNSNIAVGVNAMQFFTEGGENTCLGTTTMAGLYNEAGEAEKGEAKGSRNVALGANAMERTIGVCNDNVVVGHSIAPRLKEVSDIVAIGNYAMNKATTGGSGSIAIGYEALGEATTAEKNVCIGYYAGQKLTTGKKNTFLGYLAGSEAGTSSEGCVIIGYNAGHEATLTNELYIHNTFSASPLIWGKFASSSELKFNAEKMGFFSKTPAVKPTESVGHTGFAEVGGTAVKSESTFTGNLGSTKYSINGIVESLKKLGLLTE